MSKPQLHPEFFNSLAIPGSIFLSRQCGLLNLSVKFPCVANLFILRVNYCLAVKTGTYKSYPIPYNLGTLKIKLLEDRSRCPRTFRTWFANLVSGRKKIFSASESKKTLSSFYRNWSPQVTSIVVWIWFFENGSARFFDNKYKALFATPAVKDTNTMMFQCFKASKLLMLFNKVKLTISYLMLKFQHNF